MKHLFLLALFGIQSFASAQFLERDVHFSAAGNYASIGTLQLQSNIGELMAETFSDGSFNMLSQGFVQPEAPVITAVATKDPNISASIYPNPVTTNLYIRLEQFDLSDVKIEVYDIVGKLIIAEAVADSKAAGTFSVDFEKFIPGIYMIRISSAKSKFSKTYKVNKI